MILPLGGRLCRHMERAAIARVLLVLVVLAASVAATPAPVATVSAEQPLHITVEGWRMLPQYVVPWNCLLRCHNCC